jgi:membrane-anchored glycerophosphoryl diester phosphodiesterase (GDPDase)
MSNAIQTAVKLLVACLAVGFVLSFFGLDALGALGVVSDAIHWAVDNASELLRSGSRYILLGAVIVVPIFLIHLALRLLRRR